MIRNGTKVNKVQFTNETSFLIRESYDLGGLQVRSLSLPWSPYLIQSNCTTHEANSQKCNNHGYLIDFMEMTKQMYNFTYISLKDANQDWGITPKSGPFNLSGTWSGVMGNVIKGEYDMSLSAWYWIYNRMELLSFAPVVRSR